ncbi:TnsA-like heteromeric transposase endonuclease subunit [Microlunatus parietis]|uniref:TnsA endonuclease N-terminal domain-containing protein n=1 Tax=Microlunatus parietis TaxID=682979 RepID=A0A7Y9L9T1_9ACTN|nr:TnsA-like heteromeric transposase endonuclease subunit [Microlunatus parietis]NYE68975.1 hypothetical protein [Microlunatus parietis]NYE72104.1 hypothetical protein [Microlunatus parietis]
MGTYSVSFKDAAGEESTTDLALVPPRILVAGSPWRTFRWRHGQPHYSGWYWSSTVGAHVVYESRLELARLLLADFDPEIVAIAAQPFCVTAEVDGVRRRHVPDFLLLHADESVTVVNVKPADQLDRPKIAEALEWAEEVFTSCGWRHEVWSGIDPTRLSNVRFLAAYRHPNRVDQATVTRLAERSRGSASLGQIEAEWPDAAEDVRAAALHLVWRGVFRADLDAPLSAATVLEHAA